MRIRGWRLPPGTAPWPDGAEHDTGTGAALVSPTPDVDAVRGLMRGLVQGGEALRRIPAARIAETLGRVGARFLSAGDPMRTRALEALPSTAGISAAQARHVLDGMARDWTADALARLVAADFAEPSVLDGYVAAPLGDGEGRRVTARPLAAGGRPAVHVCSGTVPGVSLTSLIRGLLVKGPVLVKPGAGDVMLPLVFIEALHEAEGPVAAALAAATAVVWWPGGSGGDLERAVLETAGSLVVYGSDETVAAVRKRADRGIPVVTYPHRVSVAVAGSREPVETGRALARAVAAYDQRGCVSPQQLFVLGPPEAAIVVAEALGAGLDTLDRTLPPGTVSADQAAAVQQLRGTVELRQAAGEGVHLLRGPGTRWTVVVDPEPVVRPSCLSRTVHVTPVEGLDTLVEILRPLGPHLQSVGTGGLPPDQAREVAEAMAEMGASRVTPLEGMAFPGPGWRHDGQGPLQRLVRWCTWENPTEGGAE